MVQRVHGPLVLLRDSSLITSCEDLALLGTHPSSMALEMKGLPLILEIDAK